MHSRLYQISKAPINEDDRITERDMYDGGDFVPTIADYVSEIEEGYDKEDVEWFAKALNGVAEFDGKSFTIINKEAYFREKFNNFLESIDELKRAATFEAFIDYKFNSLSDAYYSLKNAYDYAYAFYITSDYNGYETLDSFMRWAEEGEKYYIGTVFDYHY